MIPAYAIKDDVLTKLSEIVVQRIWTDETDVEEIFGNEIITAYEHYTGPSCMNGDRCIFMGTCAKNESKVSLLTARDSHGEFVAKALLWRTDQGGLFLDRVYHHDRHYSKGLAIVGYARSLDADVPENPFAGRLNSHKTVTLDFSKCDYVPYFDSFVSVLKQNEDLTEVVLSTDGFVDLQSPRGRGRYVCVNCRTRHIGRICPKCDSDYILSDNIDGIECGHCGSCDLVERIEDGNRTFYVCDECLEEYHS